ncbi:MAG: metallophosphoesterase [Candidatus Bipolaricaulota bacterium]
MKALVLSDVVREVFYAEDPHRTVGEIDIILSCGDLPYEYLEYVLTMLNAPLLYVYGNHDRTVYAEGGAVKEGPEGGVGIDGRVVTIRTRRGDILRVAGLGGSRRYNAGSHQYSEAEMRARIRRMSPRLFWNLWRQGRGADLVISHAAPWGIHDNADPCHRGFRAYVKLIDRFRPRVWLHGHVHPEYQTDLAVRRRGDTEVRSVYGYSVVEVNP